MSKTCKFKGCECPAKTKGYCNGHYKQRSAGKKLTPLGGPGRRRKEVPVTEEPAQVPPGPPPEPYPPWPGELSGIHEHLWNMKAVANQHESCDHTPLQK